jgi:hypothetical protein
VSATRLQDLSRSLPDSDDELLEAVASQSSIVPLVSPCNTSSSIP